MTERGADVAWVRAALTGPMTSVHPVFTREGDLDFDGLPDLELTMTATPASAKLTGRLDTSQTFVAAHQ